MFRPLTHSQNTHSKVRAVRYTATKNEYQLAVKKMRPDLHVAMAADGDYGPAYIGTTKAHAEGGYETSPTASNVAPEVEPVLMGAMKQLRGAKK